MYSLKALSRVRVLAQSHYNDPIHLPLAEHTRIPTFFVSKEIQRCLVSTYTCSNRNYKYVHHVHHTLLVSRSERQAISTDTSFEIKMMMKIYAIEIIFKSHESFQSYLLTGQADSAKKAG